MEAVDEQETIKVGGGKNEDEGRFCRFSLQWQPFVGRWWYMSTEASEQRGQAEGQAEGASARDAGWRCFVARWRACLTCVFSSPTADLV